MLAPEVGIEPGAEVSVSIVIPCYNPKAYLCEAIESAWAQTHRPAEVILVNDGSDEPDSCELLKSLAPRISRRIDQANRGPGAARNAGCRAATGNYVVPLDSDDRLATGFVAECIAALRARPDAAFAYTDYQVFGDSTYVERLSDYNLYSLLDRNAIPYAALIRRADWEIAGGYDESRRVNYEDWDFWLRLAEQQRFGYHIPKVLLHYRKSAGSMFTRATELDRELRAGIRAQHRTLYSRDGRACVKRSWAPAVCLLGDRPAATPAIEDWQQLSGTDPRNALQRSPADAFLLPAGEGGAHPDDGEQCALAVWGGHSLLKLPDGATCVSRKALSSAGSLGELSARAEKRASPEPEPAGSTWPGRWEQLHRHLVNAELTSASQWLRDPVGSLARLIPLRFKERINRAAGRSVFDLSFYLKFQPDSVLVTDAIVPLLRYLPPPTQRLRIGLITPHLGPGGAESVLLEAAAAIDRTRCEVFLLATQSPDSRWRPRWEQVSDHIYDLAALVAPERVAPAICSIAANWEFDTVFLQNSLAAYSAIPQLRRERPAVRILDLIHAVDPTWDFVSSTAAVAGQIDRRVVISEAGRERLLKSGVAGDKIQMIRNGVDLERFRPAPLRANDAQRTILFAGRIEAVKRPLLLVDIAAELVRLRRGQDFRVVVAGDGPESDALRERIRRAGLEPVFELLGHVSAMPAVLAGADVLVLPSKGEGIPLVVLEAFAVSRPVVCSRVGSLEEVVDSTTGVLIAAGAGEAHRFAAALQDLMEDHGRRDVMGKAARRKVEAEYDLRNSRRAYGELLGGQR